MPDYEQAVFISYAWGGEREEIVNQIDRTLHGRGIKIIRDKRDVGYKGSISKFMERIGQGDCVILVISDKYLRSPNCMFELVEIAENKNFQDRIFPIVLADADIYKPVKQLEYIKHWEKEIRELKESLVAVDPTHLEGIYDQLNLYDRIRDHISRLTAVLSDMNTLTPDMHRDSDFSEIYDAIGERLKEIQGLVGIETIAIEYFEPETTLIPEGPFWMGSEPGNGVPNHETPQHEVRLPSYRIGKYPVTNAQYENFVRETGKLVAPAMGWDGQRVPIGLENHPVTGVTWYEARAYCEWLSKKTGRTYSLPHEAQWEKACRAGGKSIYPWGDEFDPTRCNHGNSQLAPVNAYPTQNDYGLFDLVGNVRQWTATLWGEKLITPDPNFAYPWRDDRRNDLNANRQIRRVMRGGSFKEDPKCLRCSARSGQFPDDAGLLGTRHSFRVVMKV
jgi:formylglycine-generating enzyme required for sulfatase activity